MHGPRKAIHFPPVTIGGYQVGVMLGGKKGQTGGTKAGCVTDARQVGLSIDPHSTQVLVVSFSVPSADPWGSAETTMTLSSAL